MAPLLRRNDLVLFQGDSITNAFRMPDEINNAYQLGAGYALMAAAEVMAQRPDDNIRFVNRGVSGNRVGDLLARWQTDCIELRPTVVSILIGINSVIGETDQREFIADYRRLLDQTLQALPGTRLIVCEPFALVCGMIGASRIERLRSTQAGIRAMAQEMEVLFVPIQQRFDQLSNRPSPEYWIYDGIHPTAPGHRLIADAWLEAIGSS